MHTLVLASQSPRRKKILENAYFQFITHPVNISEYLEENLNTDEQIKSIARRKAEAAYLDFKDQKGQRFLILSADTLVIHNGLVFGKPESTSDAQKCLRLLSGSKHLVKTAVCLIDTESKKMALELETTEVEFKKLSEKEINDYIATGEPMDKAGSYGYQGLGRQFVKNINGHEDNVVGLPMKLFLSLLEKNHWKVSVSK